MMQVARVTFSHGREMAKCAYKEFQELLSMARVVTYANGEMHKMKNEK